MTAEKALGGNLEFEWTDRDCRSFNVGIDGVLEGATTEFVGRVFHLDGVSPARLAQSRYSSLLEISDHFLEGIPGRK